jgi:hypothetical protein
VLVLDGSEKGALTVPLRPTGTVTGRLVSSAGKPLAGLSFQVAYDDGPGRPGVYFSSGGYRHRFPTPAEKTREERTAGFLEGRTDYLAGNEVSDSQGRFRLTGLLPEVAFDLKVQLTRDAGKPMKNPIIAGMVKVARPTVKPGEVLDLGELKVETGGQ